MIYTGTATPNPRQEPRAGSAVSGPQPQHVADLTALLDLMTDFSSNEQRARYLLSSNWMREHGAAAATWNAIGLHRALLA